MRGSGWACRAMNNAHEYVVLRVLAGADVCLSVCTMAAAGLPLAMPFFVRSSCMHGPPWITHCPVRPSLIQWHKPRLAGLLMPAGGLRVGGVSGREGGVAAVVEPIEREGEAAKDQGQTKIKGVRLVHLGPAFRTPVWWGGECDHRTIHQEADDNTTPSSTCHPSVLQQATPRTTCLLVPAGSRPQSNM